MSSAQRVLLRARSGPRVGLGHVMRTRAVAEELRARGAAPLLVLDEEHSAATLRAQGFEALAIEAHPRWTSESARGAWLDGFVDWTDELRLLARQGTPSVLVENRTAAREWAGLLVHPALHYQPDAWERVHAARVRGGAPWIPLGSAVRAQGEVARDLDLLVTFGGSDPLRSSERVLAALPEGLRVAVSVGTHMQARRSELAHAARHLQLELLAADTPLAPWMARARLALTAVGTTLYELAHLRTPALILANYEDDRPALEHYRAHGPFQVLGLARELDQRALAQALGAALAEPRAPLAPIAGLGTGAARLAAELLAPPAVARAA